MLKQQEHKTMTLYAKEVQQMESWAPMMKHHAPSLLDKDPLNPLPPDMDPVEMWERYQQGLSGNDLLEKRKTDRLPRPRIQVRCPAFRLRLNQRPQSR